MQNGNGLKFGLGTLVLFLAAGAGIFFLDPFTPSDVKECEVRLVHFLKSPSSYKRIGYDIYGPNEIDRAEYERHLRRYMYLTEDRIEKIKEKISYAPTNTVFQQELEREEEHLAIQEKNIKYDLDRVYVDGNGKVYEKVVRLHYEAANSFGALLQDYHRCKYLQIENPKGQFGGPDYNMDNP